MNQHRVDEALSEIEEQRIGLVLLEQSVQVLFGCGDDYMGDLDKDVLRPDR